MIELIELIELIEGWAGPGPSLGQDPGLIELIELLELIELIELIDLIEFPTGRPALALPLAWEIQSIQSSR